MPPGAAGARFEAIIGLEVHAQLLTRTKCFCPCSTSFGAPANTHVCPVCLGLPGALPVLNVEAVKMAVRAALALGCVVHPRSIFARKNYFYPDLPKGYQISQFAEPLATDGRLTIETFDTYGKPTGVPTNGNRSGRQSTEVDEYGTPRAVNVGGGSPSLAPDLPAIRREARIIRVHMEEDAGKNLHGFGGHSVVDLNRAGTPLIEIVGAPDLRSGEEAAEYLRQLRNLLMFLKVCDGNMEQGSFRCDANVSVRPEGTTSLGTRTEVKNVNSFRFVQRAIEHEVARQIAVIRAGGHVELETRGWDEKSGRTVTQRSKEEAHDYRYFPEPDLPPLVLDDGFVEAERRAVGEAPWERRKRLSSELGLSASAAGVITSHVRIADFFEQALLHQADPIKVANFVQSEVMRDTELEGISARFPVTPQQVAELVALVDEGTISGKQAKEVYSAMRGTDRSPMQIAEERGIKQLSDRDQLNDLCAGIVERSPKQVEQYRKGKKAVLGYFVGQVMKDTGGSASPQIVRDILERLLQS